MSDEPTFLDLYALTKITPDSVVERFGSSINSSFFDASNILGGLKIKKLIDFTTLFGNQNAITITDEGKRLLDEAGAKAAEPFDHLDLSVLTQLSSGSRSPNDLSTSMNITPRDLAMHIYKMQSQGFISAEFRNGNLSMSLTEKGFMQAKAGMPSAAAPMVQQAGAVDQAGQVAQQMGETVKQELQPEQRSSKPMVIAVIVIVAIVVAIFALWQLHIISLP